MWAGSLVTDCVVVARDAGLVAYVVPHREMEDLSSVAACLSQFTSGRRHVARVDALPLTADGEVDLAALCALPVIDDEVLAAARRALGAANPGAHVTVASASSAERPLAYHADELTPAPAPPPSPVAHVARDRPAIADGGPFDDTAWPRSLGEVLRLRATGAAPEADDLIFLQRDGSGRRRSYHGLWTAARRVAGGLRTSAAAERVIVALPTPEEQIVAVWGCVVGGLVPVPFALAAAPRDDDPSVIRLRQIASAYGIRRVVTSRATAATLRALLPALAIVALEEAAAAEPVDDVEPAAPDATAIVFLTSGSTGLPKAVPLSHRNLCASIALTARANRLSAADVSLNWMPLDHPGPLIRTVLRCVHVGCRQIHAEPAFVLEDVLRWLVWIERYRVTTTWAPNFAFGLVNDALERRREAPAWDLSSLRSILNTAEPIVMRTAQAFLSHLRGCGLDAPAMLSSWGMAETSSSVTFAAGLASSAPDAPIDLGRPIPGVAMRIRAAGAIASEGVVGELEVRGVTVTRGYDGDAADAFTEDGWLRTGDLGTIVEGRLSLTGRAKDIVIVGGVNRSCHEIEAVVVEVPGVARAHVAATAVRTAADTTDRLAVFFCATVDGDDLARAIAEIRRRVAAQLGLRATVVLPIDRASFPTTSLGKPMRAQLRAAFERLTGAEHLLPSWFYERRWRPRRPRPAPRAAGVVLIFADEIGVSSIAAGEQVVRVRPGPGFARPGADEYVVDPRSAEDYGRLFEALARDGLAPRRVLHCWTCTAAVPAGDEGATLERGLVSVALLARAMRAAAAPADVLVASTFAQVVRPDDAGLVEPMKAALVALVKTAGEEHPDATFRHVDVEARDPAAAGRQLDVELHGSSDREVAYRGGVRLVARLAHVDLRTRPFASPPRLVAGGIYVVTGGLGGLGREVTAHLLRELRARVLLLGRRPHPRDAGDAARTADLAALERLPGEVRYATADLCDASAVDAAVRGLAGWNGAIAGVFHMAGAMSARLVAEETRETLAAAIAPKLIGTRNAARLAARAPGAFLAISSSVNGFFPAVGKGAYCAANSAAEALVETLRAEGMPAYALAWSMWEGVGMAPRGEIFRVAAQARGFDALSVDDGIRSLNAALAREPASLYVGLDERHRLVRAVLEAPPAALVVEAAVEGGAEPADALRDPFGLALTVRFTHAAAPRVETAKAAYQAPRNDLERRLAAIFSRVLGGRPVGIADRFFDLGGDSLAAVQIASAAQEEGLSLTMGEIYERGTVEALALRFESRAAHTTSAPAVDRMSLMPFQSFAFEAYVDPLRVVAMPRLYDSTAPIDLGALEEALALLLERHAALRAAVLLPDEGGAQTIVPLGRAPVVPVRISTKRSSLRDGWSAARAALDAHAARHVVLMPVYVGDEAACHTIGVLVSHLVTDLVSQEILHRELLNLYARRIRGEAAAPPLSTTPLSTYTERLVAAARRGDAMHEYPHWTRLVARVREAERVRPTGDGGAVGTTARLIGLPSAAREQLRALGDRAAGRDGLAAVFYAAGLRAVGTATGASELLVHLTANGRADERLADLDLSRTIGAFATVCPLLAPVPAGPMARAVAATASHLAEVRARHGDGLGYWMLRQAGRAELALIERRPEEVLRNGVLFNWLGGGRGVEEQAGPLVRRPAPNELYNHARFPWVITGLTTERGFFVTIEARSDVCAAPLVDAVEGELRRTLADGMEGG